MSDEEDDYKVGYGKPPLHTRFKPGECPNKKGRGKKNRRALVPSQIRKDVLEAADEVIEVKTAKGVRKLTKQQLIITAISNGAAKGNPTCLRLWIQLLETALNDRMEAYPTVRLIDMLLREVEDPRFDPDPMTVAALDAHLKLTKRSY
jgi:hypothetical protein